MVPDKTLEITPNTWIISDMHFFHENIGRYCNRPENWQELIIKNWNDLISSDEIVLHLGDFALGKKSNFELLTGMVNGRLLGNCVIRCKSASDSGANRPPIPEQIGQRIRSKSATFSLRPESWSA